MPTADPPAPECALCRRSRADVRFLVAVAATGAAICDACVLEAVRLLIERPEVPHAGR